MLVQNDESAKFIIEADRKGHKVAKILVDYFMSALVSLYIFTAIIRLAVNFFQNGYIDNDRLYVPYPLK